MVFPTSAGGLFSQGAFQIDPNATPEQLARKRELLAAMMPTYGKARYVGEGLGQLATGVMAGRKGKALDKFEAEKAEEAANLFSSVMGGGGPMSILGVPPDAPMGTPFNAPSPELTGPQQIGNDAMAAIGQPPKNAPKGREAFIDAMMPHAMRVSQRTGLDPRLVIAQAAQETGWGKSAPGNNYFGIKSHGKGGGNTFATNEVINGQTVRINDSFRGYGDMGESADGYASFLQENPRYREMLSAGDLEGQLAALGKSGYATDPNYARSVGSIANSIPMPQGGGSFTPGPGVQVAQSGPAMADLMQAAQNPWLSPQQRALIMAEIQREQGVHQSQQERMGRREDFTWEQDQRYQDPAYLMEIERQRIELERMKNPQPGFMVLSPQEVQQLGLPTGAYQRGPDGKVSAVGGGGVTVNNNMGDDPSAARLGTIPQGYTAIEDPNSPAGYRMVAIPGGPEDTTAASAVKAGNASIASSIVTTAAARAREAAGKREFGGMGSGLIGMINPYSDSAEVIRQVEVLKSNARIENLTAMRAASPTGGALGAVSDKENDMLAAKSGALDPRSPNFLRDLDDYERALLGVVHGPEEGDRIFAETRVGKAATAPSSSSDTVPPPPPGANPATWPTASEWQYMTPEEKALFQ